MWAIINRIKEFLNGNKKSDDGKSKVKDSSKKLGEDAAKSVAKGVKKGKVEVIQQVEKVAVSLTSKLKEDLGLSGSNNVLRDEIGKMIPAGIAGGITLNSKSAVTAFEQVRKTLDYQRQLDIINDEQYYAAIESLRDKYFEKGSDKWIYYTQEIYAYQKELLAKEKERYEETYDDIFEYASDKIDAVIEKQAAYEKKLSSYGQVFQKNTIRLDEGDIEFYSLADLKSDNEKLERYASLMLEAKEFVKSSGMSDEAVSSLLEEISSLPVNSASTALEALMKNPLSGEWLKEYERRIELSKSSSALYYQDEMDEAIDESTEYMEKKLSEAGFEIPETFFDAGKDSAIKFGQGFSEKLDAELQKIKAQIAEFTSDIEINVKGSSENSGSSGDEINTTNYYITAGIKEDISTAIRRYETIKRLGGC